MQPKTVDLIVPAEAEFARSVRMLAANLAVVCGLTIDDVEDVRMAAEEGFVYSCATDQTQVAIHFTITDAKISMEFTLGDAQTVEDAYADGSFAYAQLILGSVTDEFVIDDEHRYLKITKATGGLA